MKNRLGKTVRTGFGDTAATPTIDAAKCRACGLCVKVCKSFTIVERGEQPSVEPDHGLGCIGCGQCMAVCPHDAVTVTGRGLGPTAAFDLPPKELRATPEALQNLLVCRRSVREFSERPVDKTVVERVLQIASSAPMGVPPSDVGVTAIMGRQRVWDFSGELLTEFSRWLVFGNPLMRAVMRPFMKKTDLETMRDFLVPVVRLMLDARRENRDLLFYHAPCVLVFHQSPYADPADGHIAGTYAMIAADSLGLGTCMIGTVAFGLERNADIKVRWGIPSENTPAIAMILGYPAFKYARGLKRSFAALEYR